MVARPRVDDSCTQKSVRYVTRVKHELNFGSALVARFCKQNQQSARRRKLPDVVTSWMLGVERVLKEVGAKVICVICTTLNLSCSLPSSSFFRARPEKFVAGGCKENTRPLTTTIAQLSPWHHRFHREHATVLCDSNVCQNFHSFVAA